MTDLRTAAQQALEALESVFEGDEKGAQYWTVTGGTYEAVECKQAITTLRAALEQPERTLTDEVIADLWHKNGGFHHHFAKAIERYLKGSNQ